MIARSMPLSREAALRNALQAMLEGVLVWSLPAGVLSECNEAAARILGVPRGELIGRTIQHPWVMRREDGSPLPREERGAVVAVQTGQSQPTMVVRVGRPDGSWAWVRTTSVVLRDTEGVPYAVFTTFIDVTELRESQDRVKQAADRLTDAVAGADVGTWELDVATRQITGNERWGQILGPAAGDAIDTLDGFIDRIHPDERDRCVATVAEGLETGEPFVFESRIARDAGRWHWIQARGRVVSRGDDGRPRRAAGVLIDVDARRRGDEALRVALVENERLVRELKAALESVRTLEGLLPICMYCKAIRDDAGQWSSVESFVTKRTEAEFSHGLCPPCYTKHFSR